MHNTSTHSNKQKFRSKEQTSKWFVHMWNNCSVTIVIYIYAYNYIYGLICECRGELITYRNYTHLFQCQTEIYNDPSNINL